MRGDPALDPLEHALYVRLTETNPGATIRMDLSGKTYEAVVVSNRGC